MLSIRFVPPDDQQPLYIPADPWYADLSVYVALAWPNLFDNLGTTF